MKLFKKLMASAMIFSSSLPILATNIEGMPFVTGSVISGTEQFEEDLQTRRINSTEEIEWIQISAGSQGGADPTFFHPTDPDYIYVLQNMKTSYMSTDNMSSIDTWETISDEDTYGPSLSMAHQMQFSLQNENYGIAVTETGLFVTYDKGKNWRPFAEHQFSHQWTETIPTSALAIDRINDDIMYVGAGGMWLGKIARTDKNRQEPNKNEAPRGVIYKTLDGGKTWTEHSNGLPENAEIGHIFIHPKKPNILYVATSHGVFISEDAGNTYQSRNDSLADPISNEVYLRDMAFHYDWETEQVTLVTALLTIWAKDENSTLTHTSGGVYKSLDEGKTWVSLNEGLMVDYAPFRDTNGSGTVQGYNVGIGKWFGINNRNQTAEEIKIPEKLLPSFTEVEINPQNPDILYVVNCGRKENGVEPEGVWISEDGGANWFNSTRIGVGYQENSEYWKSQYAPSDVDLTTRNVYVGGEEDWSWMFDGSYPMLAYQCLNVSPDGKTLMIHVFKSRIASRNGGRTWTQVDAIEVADDVWIGRGDSNVPGKYVFSNPDTDEVLFISGETGLWKLNTEVDYSHLDTEAIPMERIDIENQVSCPGAAIAFHPEDSNTIYCVVDRLDHRGEFMKSTNRGQDWESISKIFDVDMSESIKAYSLLIDKNNPDTMYFAIPVKTINDTKSKMSLEDEKRGVYKTTDGGVTWNVMNNGIDAFPADINALAFSNDHKTIYAASMRENGGLYQSIDGAQNWTKMQIPEGVNSVNDITVAPSGRIIISTGFGTSDPELCEGGMYYSDDNGATWTQGFSGRFIIDTAVDPNNEDRMVITMGGSGVVGGLNEGMFMTTDSGASWIKINNGIGNPNRTTEVMFDPVDPNVMWASSYASGFYKMVLPEGYSSSEKVMTTEDFDISELPIFDVLHPEQAIEKTYSIINLNSISSDNIQPYVNVKNNLEVALMQDKRIPTNCLVIPTTINDIEAGKIVNLLIKFQDDYYIKNGKGETKITVTVTNNIEANKNIEIIVPTASITFMDDTPLGELKTATLKFIMPETDVDISKDLNFSFNLN
ncbi:hypothetical protein AN641_09550 [Candidatus Epulonipiscioides gigas]|nr:hypothetical protein AN641_09550 [Epulopiscium sp. SCG-C07WGA-EpuloA2]